MSCVRIVVKCPRCGKLDACADFTHRPSAAERKAARTLILEIHKQAVHAGALTRRKPTASPEGRGEKRTHA